jgi:A/G-specific adenine glycosylase
VSVEIKAVNGNSSHSIHDVVALPPQRRHSTAYHEPLLISYPESKDALLSWFDATFDNRSMPWRKAWIHPKLFEGSEEELINVLDRRAYEVWVSEVSKYCSGQFLIS